MDSITLCSKCGNSVSFDYQFNLLDNLPVLWRSTGPLPKEDEAPYRQSIADATSELEKIDRAVREVMSVLDNFGAKRRDLETFIERQSARIAPIRRVPNEMLELIFHYTSTDTGYEAVTFHDRSTVAEVPIWAVGLVCKQWYDVSTQSQTLWNKINYGGPNKIIELEQRREKNNLLRIALSRSFNVPLDLDLQFGLTARDLNKSIAPNAHRIRSLDFNPKSFRLFKSQCNFPLLESLRLCPPSGVIIVLSDSDSDQPGWFKNSRLLRRIELSKDSFWRQGLELPWDVIEDVSSGHIGNAEIQLLSNRCSNLKTLKLSDRFPNSDGPAEQPNISNEVLFKNLENLIINDFYWSNRNSLFLALLDKLRVPRLKLLDIQIQPFEFQYDYFEPYGQENISWPYEPIRSLVRQVAGSLEILHLKNTWSYTERQLLDLLSLLPLLREFSFDSDDRIKKLSFDELLSTRQVEILPRLENLDLTGHSVVFTESVLENLSERCGQTNQAGAHSHLHKLTLQFLAVEFPEDSITRLENMRRGGMHICINGSYCNWKAKQIIDPPLSVASPDYDFHLTSTPFLL